MEFFGKNVDEAIEKACAHFQLEREKLNIEILDGGSTGIFGLVGTKKARISATPFAGIMPAVEEPVEQKPEPQPEHPAEARSEAAPGQAEEKPREGGSRRRPRRRSKRSSTPVQAPEEQDVEPAATVSPAAAEHAPETALPSVEDAPTPVSSPPDAESAPREKKPRPKPARRECRPQGTAEEEKAGSAPNGDLDDFDPEENNGEERVELTPEQAELLAAQITTALLKLIEPVTSTATISVDTNRDPVLVTIDDDENSGLLIGREGQTLSAFQYVLNRIVQRTFSERVRIQLDTGGYRDQQRENLTGLALYLAQRARESNRAQSTKPLSSYHRRLVHVALQSVEGIQTRSKGEGPLKRVLILPRRERRPAQEKPTE